MIKVDKENVKMEGSGMELQAEICLAIISLACSIARKSNGVLSKKGGATLLLGTIKDAVLHSIEEVNND